MLILGKRKYRRNQYDNTNHQVASGSKRSHGSDRGHENVAALLNQSSMEKRAKFEDGHIDENSGQEKTNTPSSATPTQFVCRLCQEGFVQYRFLVEHMALSHFNHIWNADVSGLSENGQEASLAPNEENPYAVANNGPYNCHLCYEYQTDNRNKFIIHLALRHDVLKPMMGEYSDFKVDEDNAYDGTVGVEDVDGEAEGVEACPDIDFDEIDDEMEEEDIGDVDGEEEEYEEESFQTGVDQDEVTVDELDGLNVGEIDVPSDVENESDDEVQIQ